MEWLVGEVGFWWSAWLAVSMTIRDDILNFECHPIACPPPPPPPPGSQRARRGERPPLEGLGGVEVRGLQQGPMHEWLRCCVKVSQKEVVGVFRAMLGIRADRSPAALGLLLEFLRFIERLSLHQRSEEDPWGQCHFV